MKYAIRSPLCGPFEFEADSDIDAYGKFCARAGYTVFAACTIQTMDLHPMHGDSVARDLALGASLERNKHYRAKSTVYGVKPWANGYAIFYLPSGISVEWFARKCDATRVLNRRYNTYNP
jgi:hypothetical protein